MAEDSAPKESIYEFSRTGQEEGRSAGPGIGDYRDLEKLLPNDYASLLTPKETQHAIFEVKRYIEDNLCQELNLMMVEVPLIVDAESGVNDMLDVTARARRFSFTSRTIATCTRLMRRWYKLRRNGKESR